MTDSRSNLIPAADSLADEVTSRPAARFAVLDQVGMRGMEMPVRMKIGQALSLLPAHVSASVNLCDPCARGIHMSRLYRLCDKYLTDTPLTQDSVEQLLAEMLVSHTGLSNEALVAMDFSLPLRRPALLSGLSGWRQYPVRIQARKTASAYRCQLSVEVLYSSTCPGSAAMARQVVQQRFVETFGTGAVDAVKVAQWLASPEGGAATPHAQRSRARVDVSLSLKQGELPFLTLIDQIENALKTPVQGAVKRLDEQEFARLNGENPMYCEDAARRILAALQELSWLDGLRIEVAHLESLHPHDAVARVAAGTLAN